MAYDDAKFRALFPEYADTTKYSEVLISLLYDVACDFIDPRQNSYRSLNGSSLILALNYMTAHLLYLQTQRTNADSGNEGDTVGAVQSASIGEISVTKASIPNKDQWQYWLTSSSYGQLLLALLSVKSVGGLSVGGLAERTGFRKIGGVFF